MTEATTYPNATIDPARPVIVLTRTFNAPASLVFKAWTTSEHLQQWWAPGPFTMPVSKLDLRVGGTWHYAMQSPEGELYWAKTTYREITPSTRLVMLDAFSDEAGTTIPPESLVTVSFEEAGGRTTATVHTEFATIEDRDKVVEMGMIEGFNMGFDKLDTLLASLQ